MRSLPRILLLTALAAPGIGQMEEAPFFSLSSNRTFGANGQPSVSMSAYRVDSLDFRIYRINDAVKFFEQLQEPHQFGGSVRRPTRKPTLLELLHHWKHALRTSIRLALRGQFTEPPSAHFEEFLPRKAAPAERGTRYAEAPVLNPQQLVLTFTQPVHSTYRWNSETVDIGVKEKGLYLVEAASGDLRAYTILMVSDTVMITKTSSEGALAFVTNRATGQAVAGAEVAFIRPGADTVRLTTNADGIAQAKLEPLSTQPGERTSDLRIVARSGSDIAAVAPWGWNTREEWSGYLYTDRPVYRPGHAVHFKGILRVRAAVGYDVPAGKPVQVKIQDPDSKPVYQRTLTTSANGTIQDQFDLAPGAALGDYYIEVNSGGEQGEGEQQMMGNFAVQEYKKPEYEVRVTPSKLHVIEGDGVDAVIDARYYFGEPVAGAKVKYTIYRSRYWAPFFYEPDEEESAEEGEGDTEDNEIGGEQIEQTEGQLDQDGKPTIHFDTSISDKRYDYRYRIEAGVTDEGKREISGTGWVIASYGSFTVNAEPDRYIYRPGDKANFKVEARDYANNPVQTAVHVELRKWRHGESAESTGAAADVTTGPDGTANVQLVIPD
ncbi:MAG TPA: MG2 domain-containing protein, partial [Bryobacteraceae bacterium]|nr:MG2 domain-containing protein [Bryobacteraceae bacterium]